LSKVGLVCDSTTDLEPYYLASRDIRMVPLTVFFGDESFLDWVDMRPEEFYERLSGSRFLPKTSQPAPPRFSDAYRELAESGCDSIVSVHLSSKLSGTYESAMIAAKDAPVPVHVVDTLLVSQALGLAVKAAAGARDAGMGGEGVAAEAERTAASTELFFVLETLDYLVKGGRAGRAAGLAASVLDIKPVLRFADGIIEPFRKSRGTHKAFTELAAFVAQDAAERGRLKVSLLHACSPERVALLAKALADAGADVEIESTGLVGAVVGTYAGPGAVGIACHPL
jgi:DegV family protein with EDD domain